VCASTDAPEKLFLKKVLKLLICPPLTQAGTKRIGAIMKIPGNINSLTPELKNSSTATQQSSTQKAVKAPEVSTASVEDSSVNISEASRLAQDVKAQLASYPEVDADRVADLKQKIQSGSYEVDSYSLAGKIVMLEGMIKSRGNSEQ